VRLGGEAGEVLGRNVNVDVWFCIWKYVCWAIRSLSFDLNSPHSTFFMKKNNLCTTAIIQGNYPLISHARLYPYFASAYSHGIRKTYLMRGLWAKEYGSGKI